MLPPGSSGHGYSVIPPQPTADGRVRDGAAGGSDGVSDLGKLDWFADLESFGRGEPQGGPDAAGPPAHLAAASERGSDKPKPRPWRRRVSSRWGEKQRNWAARRRTGTIGWPTGGRNPAGQALRGWRLALAAVGLATPCRPGWRCPWRLRRCAHQGGALSDPTYSVGSVPPALSDRPASSVAGIAAGTPLPS